MPESIWINGSENTKWEKVWFDDSYTPPSKIEEPSEEIFTREEFKAIINDSKKVEKIFTNVIRANDFLNKLVKSDIIEPNILKSIWENSRLLKQIISIHLSENTINSRDVITDALFRLRPQEEKYYIELLKSLPMIKWDSSLMYEVIYNNINDEKVLKTEVFKHMDTLPVLSQLAMKNIHDPKTLDRFMENWNDGKRLGLVQASIKNSYNTKLLIEIHKNLDDSNLDLTQKWSLTSSLNERVIYLNKISDENVKAGM